MILPVEQVGHVISIRHGEVGLPASFNNGRRISLRVPNGPTVGELAEFIALRGASHLAWSSAEGRSDRAPTIAFPRSDVTKAEGR